MSNSQVRFTSVKFSKYKAFKDFSLSFTEMNVLVGPNNAGKSTILGAFRILSEGIRKAQMRNPDIVRGSLGTTRGYQIDLSDIPVASENLFYDYDTSQAAEICFRLSNGNELLLYFPEQGACSMLCVTKTKPVVSTSTFKSQYPVSIGFVPILGPVEHNEPLFQKEAARLALQTHKAARNFRNIWYHYPENFEAFRELVKFTWPGMDIQPPELSMMDGKPLLRMYCPEDRIPREIYWAGFGFQVWCQLLTYLDRNRDSSVMIIDEPDVYLHADLQRQLVGILRSLGPDIVIATHSSEIVNESDTNDLVLISKRNRSGKRVVDPSQLTHIFQLLGSNLNPVLTQIAKCRRILFVEGNDFQVISRFARKLNLANVASRSDFAVVPAGGFNPTKVAYFLEGIRNTLGVSVIASAVFDRDYRGAAECKDVAKELMKHCRYVHIHEKKELENFLLNASCLTRAIELRLIERMRRTGKTITFTENMDELLSLLTDPLKHSIQAKHLVSRFQQEKSRSPNIHDSTINESILKDFELTWGNIGERLKIVPGKEVLSMLNKFLQGNYEISITDASIVDAFLELEIDDDMRLLIKKLEEFRREAVEA
jgi:energy-coupling factor transporter ATP-binding protein EcfA2